jgi:ribA/ribD-fused uncharacterized protein
MTVRFGGYRTDSGPFRDFSNFAPYPIVVGGITYKTIEHYYQAQKTIDAVEQHNITQAPTAAAAQKLGKVVKLREDWDRVKLNIMYRGLIAKFTQHDELKTLLLSTVGQDIEEVVPWDNFWGTGRDGKGANHLGRMLMVLRHRLENEES